MRFLLTAIALTASAIAAEFPAPFNTEPAGGAPMTPDQAAANRKSKSLIMTFLWLSYLILPAARGFLNMEAAL